MFNFADTGLPHSARDSFRDQFQHVYSVFLRKGFRPEQCFQFVWEKTLDRVSLPQSDQRKLRQEMKQWTRRISGS